MMYANTAVGFYRDFIDGWFKKHIRLLVPMIATGQLMIGAGMLAGRKWLVIGCMGIIVFLMAIAPLGVGSAFPFSITVSIAAYFVFRHWQKETKQRAEKLQTDCSPKKIL
jgi:membrane protein implicated in regulation of membrane protease activity